MSPKFLIFSTFLMAAEVFCEHHQNFSLLLDFTCATAKDELEKHPEMRTIAMVELENNFPSEFSREVLKCLPTDVAKFIVNPRDRDSLMLPKETMIIYLVDKKEWTKSDSFHTWQEYNARHSPVVHHLSKHLILISDMMKVKATVEFFKYLPNVVQIYEENQKVIARSFDLTRNLTTFETFESSQRENLSQILFRDKAKNLNGQIFYATFTIGDSVIIDKLKNRPFCKWTPYFKIVAEKLNATFGFIIIPDDRSSWKAYQDNKDFWMIKLINESKLDFNVISDGQKHNLESYNNVGWCFLAPVSKPYDLTELILFLPMDKSCWMWLGITIAVSTLIWRISEGHWNFPFGSFAYFMGQGQLVIRIRTNRLMMKILLQLLIFTIFIFSNGYQSIVTSFMLNPMQERHLKTVDEVFSSDLKIEQNWVLENLYGDNPNFKRAKDEGRVGSVNIIGKNWAKKMFQMRLANPKPCEMMKNAIEKRGDGKVWQDLYLVPEPVDLQRQDLYTPPFHPYIDKFQELMDRSFEAGLHQAWEKFYWEVWKQNVGQNRTINNEKDLLDFGLIAPFFLILAFGLGFALLALWCEIFHRDFVTKLSKEYFERKWKEIFGRKKIKFKREILKQKIVHCKKGIRSRSI